MPARLMPTNVGRMPNRNIDRRVNRIAEAMMRTFDEHPESGDKPGGRVGVVGIGVILLGADEASGEGTVVWSQNIPEVLIPALLLECLRAELLGSGLSVNLVADRPQG